MATDTYSMHIIVKIGLEFVPLVLGVCCALFYSKQGRKGRTTDLIQTAIASGIFWAFIAGELVGPSRIELEAVVFDCSAFLIGWISVWFISHRTHNLKTV